VQRSEGIDGLPNVARDGCKQLEGVIEKARRELFADKKAPSVVARALLEGVGMQADVSGGAPTIDASARRWANVEGLLETLARREAREAAKGKAGLDGLSAFLHTLTMDLESEAQDAGDVVTLSTLHGSKGLEFDVVFLIGCEEGYLPHQRTLDPRATDAGEGGAGDIEEERRLFYVGVTRARERLVMSRARSRVLRGKAIARTPSRFLLDVPASLVDEMEVKDAAPTTQAETAASVEAILAMLAR
jgi:DNA helicase-2/ATP-dependent DNA helicase PcrA